jgi:hypothetical protein
MNSKLSDMGSISAKVIAHYMKGFVPEVLMRQRCQETRNWFLVTFVSSIEKLKIGF